MRSRPHEELPAHHILGTKRMQYTPARRYPGPLPTPFHLQSCSHILRQSRAPYQKELADWKKSELPHSNNTGLVKRTRSAYVTCLILGDALLCCREPLSQHQILQQYMISKTRENTRETCSDKTQDKFRQASDIRFTAFSNLASQL
jgi:hypothetical protein